jgi:hypothetical protein
MSSTYHTKTKKITIFYDIIIQRMLTEMSDHTIDLKPAMRQVERFVSIVSNICLFGPVVVMASTENSLELHLSGIIGKELILPQTVAKIAHSSRAEIRVTRQPESFSGDSCKIRAEATFFRSAQKKLVIFNAEFAEHTGYEGWCGINVEPQQIA